MLKPSVSFQSIKFSDGTTITLDPADIVVFVGPNNAGKSAALRELDQLFGTDAQGTVISSVKMKTKGTADDLHDYLGKHGREHGSPADKYFQGMQYNFPTRWPKLFWPNDLQHFRSLFCMRIATETRITGANPQSAIAVLDEAPSHPIHLMYSDDRIEKRMSGYFHQAFGKDLIVFHGGGNQWPLLTGERPEPAAGEDRVSGTYIEKIRASTVPLHLQGDGMRSFATVVLHLFAPTTPSILMLDEPEAFLHPPQARLLGEFIAKERKEGVQLFIASHSADILQGLLNTAPENLRVIRIQRNGSVNKVKELDKAKAKEISSDPLMKFSSVMSGIFHQRVIIGESDADCMFYNALLDLPEVHGAQQPDVLFIHAAGKHRMASLAEALRALDVIVDAIADIDILNDLMTFEKLVLSMGGDWTKISPHAKALKTAIEQHKPWLTSPEVKKAIETIISNAPASGEFSKSLKREIDAVFRKASPWDAIKEAGEAAIPSGQPTIHWDSLKSECQKFGLWIVPKGELEGFCKAVGGHGPKWVQKVLETYDLKASTELEDARKFITAIWGRIA